ncbi:hypothetical protein F5Y19DRAFT_355953 [Xylariaceae sp. FL1651]|nr:hypothetical protein F5Y19DRAFT_355953 [Xylariaceae sp. FL1651]
MAQLVANMDAVQQHDEQNNEGHRSVPSTSLPATWIFLPPYYVERPGITNHTASGTVIISGAKVPVIPVDQLPSWVDILGVPRELSHEQAAGLSSLGITPKDKQYEIYLALSSNDAEIRSSQMDPAAKPFISNKTLNDTGYETSCNAKSHNSGHVKRGSTNIIASEASIKNKANTSVTSAADYRPVTGLHQRLPSPPIPDTSPTNPYPVIYPIESYSTKGARNLYLQAHEDLLLQQHPAQRLLQASYNFSPRPSTVSSAPQLSSTASLSSSPSSSTAKGLRTDTSRSDNTKINNHVSSRLSHNNGTSKIYCRHWCHHGKCKWNEACRYRHEMPRTVRELREVGLAGFPGWWETHRQLLSKHINTNTASSPNLEAAYHAARYQMSSDVNTGASGNPDVIGGAASGSYLFPMSMNMNVAAPTASTLGHLGGMMADTTIPGLFHYQHAETYAETQTQHPQLCASFPSPLTYLHTPEHNPVRAGFGDPYRPTGGKKKKKQSLPLSQQQQRDVRHIDRQPYDSKRDGRRPAAEDTHRHRSGRSTEKSKSAAAKPRARRGSESVVSYPGFAAASPSSSTISLSRSSSSSPSARVSGSSDSGSGTAGNSKQKATAATAAITTKGGNKIYHANAHTRTRAYGIRNLAHIPITQQQQPDYPEHRLGRSQAHNPGRRTPHEHEEDVFERELALAAAADEEKHEREEAEKEREKTLLKAKGKEAEGNDVSNPRAHNAGPRGREEGHEVEKLVDI